MPTAFIVRVARTAAGKRNGALSHYHPAVLGAKVVDALVDRAASADGVAQRGNGGILRRDRGFERVEAGLDLLLRGQSCEPHEHRRRKERGSRDRRKRPLLRHHRAERRSKMALRCPSLGLNHVSDVFGKTYCFALKNVQGFNQGMCDGDATVANRNGVEAPSQRATLQGGS